MGNHLGIDLASSTRCVSISVYQVTDRIGKGVEVPGIAAIPTEDHYPGMEVANTSIRVVAGLAAHSATQAIKAPEAARGLRLARKMRPERAEGSTPTAIYL